MIVRGESTIIYYHAPFDQGFSLGKTVVITEHANPHATSCIERALSTKMKNNRADGHCKSFDWI